MGNKKVVHQRFGCCFTEDQYFVMAMIGAGGGTQAEIEEMIGDRFAGTEELFQCLCNLKVVGVLQTGLLRIPDDPDRETMITWDLTPSGEAIIHNATENLKREINLRGGDV